MTLFDLFFIVLFLTAASTAIAASVFALCGQFARARRILVRLLVCAAAYMAIVIAVSLVAPRRIAKIGDPQCFDDWCGTVAGFQRAPEGANVRYSVDLLLSSRARRVSQRENNLAVYLTDARGHRYRPLADISYTPFNVLLGPGESVAVSRCFLLPAGATEVGAVIAHEGGFPIGWFIIGYHTWFRHPPAARLE